MLLRAPPRSLAHARARSRSLLWALAGCLAFLCSRIIHIYTYAYVYTYSYIYICVYTHTYVCNCTYIWLSLAVCFWRKSVLQYAEVRSRELHSVAVCCSVYFAVYFRRESMSERHTHFESRYILTLTSSYVSPDHSPTLLSLSRSSSITGPSSACCARILAV